MYKIRVWVRGGVGVVYELGSGQLKRIGKGTVHRLRGSAEISKAQFEADLGKKGRSQDYVMAIVNVNRSQA